MILEIVGKGPYKENLVKLVKNLNINERVKFFQQLPRSELLQMYASADVFVLLSKHEAYGLSVAEALCAGTPCIVANTSVLAEWVDGENCFGIDYPINARAGLQLIMKGYESMYVPDNPILHIIRESLSRTRDEEIKMELRIMKSLYIKLISGHVKSNDGVQQP